MTQKKKKDQPKIINEPSRAALVASDIVRDPTDPLDFLFDSERELPPESIGLGGDKYVVSIDIEDTHKKIDRALADPQYREELRQEREQYRQWQEEARAAYLHRLEEEAK